MEQNEGWNAALRGIFAEYAGASHQHDKTTMGAVRILTHQSLTHVHIDLWHAMNNHRPPRGKRCRVSVAYTYECDPSSPPIAIKPTASLSLSLRTRTLPFSVKSASFHPSLQTHT